MLRNELLKYHRTTRQALATFWIFILSQHVSLCRQIVGFVKIYNFLPEATSARQRECNIANIKNVYFSKVATAEKNVS